MNIIPLFLLLKCEIKYKTSIAKINGRDFPYVPSNISPNNTIERIKSLFLIGITLIFPFINAKIIQKGILKILTNITGSLVNTFKRYKSPK